MKNRLIPKTWMVLLIAVFLLSCSSIPWISKDKEVVEKKEKPSALEKISGKVAVLQGDTDIWVGATKMMEVFQGDQIRTLGNSRVQVKLPDDHKLVIGENSVVKLKEIVSDSEENRHIALTDLTKGGIWAKVDNPASFIEKLQGKDILMEFKFKISAPNTSAFPLGTKFVVMYLQDNSVLISSCKGDLEISGPGGSLLIPERHFSTVEGNNPPDPIRTAEYIEERKDDPNYKFCFSCHNENFKDWDLNRAFE